MEWKIYEEWLDITLYRQMTNLIYKLSSNEEKNGVSSTRAITHYIKIGRAHV